MRPRHLDLQPPTRPDAGCARRHPSTCTPSGQYCGGGGARGRRSSWSWRVGDRGGVGGGVGLLRLVAQRRQQPWPKGCCATVLLVVLRLLLRLRLLLLELLVVLLVVGFLCLWLPVVHRLLLLDAAARAVSPSDPTRGGCGGAAAAAGRRWQQPTRLGWRRYRPMTYHPPGPRLVGHRRSPLSAPGSHCRQQMRAQSGAPSRGSWLAGGRGDLIRSSAGSAPFLRVVRGSCAPAGRGLPSSQALSWQSLLRHHARAIVGPTNQGGKQRTFAQRLRFWGGLWGDGGEWVGAG